LNYRGKFFAISAVDLPLVLYRDHREKGKVCKLLGEGSTLYLLYFKSTV